MIDSTRLSDTLLGAASTLVEARTGLVFRDARRMTFAGEIAAAMQRAGLRDEERYLTRLRSVPELLDDLVEHVTVHESYFFREPAQFAVIRDTIVPELSLRGRDYGPMRMWSAGCSTGEEAYSLAILMHQMRLLADTRIVGTDLSRPALLTARRGRYSRWSLRGVPPSVESGYFERVGTGVTVVAAIRDAVEFREHNLAADADAVGAGIEPRSMHLILCRNVMIYLGAHAIACVAHRLLAALHESGWLLLGASDPSLADLVPCEVMVTSAGLAYRVRRPGVQRPSAAPLPIPAPTPSPSVPLTEPSDLSTVSEPLQSPPSVASTEGENVSASIARVRASANRGDLDEASRLCLAAIDRFGESAELECVHAMLLTEAGRDSEAVAAARRALYLDHTLVVAHLLLAGVLSRTGEVERARRALDNARRLLETMDPADLVPATEGLRASELSEIVRAHARLLQGVA